MKKFFPIIATAILELTGCNSAPKKISFDQETYKHGEYYSPEDYTIRVTVVSPTGAPAIGMYSFAYAWNAKFFTSNSPSTGVIPMFQSQEYGVIIAPTDSGLNQIMNLGAHYKIAATITFGNFYIVSFGRDDDATLNDGDKIVIFQENGIPGKTFKYLYGDLNLNVTAVADASMTKQIIDNNGVYNDVSYDYILTAEPIMSATNKTAFINIQDKFAEKTGGKLMTQASIFIRNDLDKEMADEFLFAVKDSIQAGLDTPDLIKTNIETLGSTEAQQGAFGVPGAMAKKVTLNNGFNLGFRFADEIKDDIKEFVKIIDPSVKL